MKKILSIALCGVLAISLVGCDLAAVESVLKDESKLALLSGRLSPETRQEIVDILKDEELMKGLFGEEQAEERTVLTGLAEAASEKLSAYDPEPSPTAEPVKASSEAEEIGLEKAKAIALEKAGLSEGAVSFTKQKREKNKPVYDIEFYSDGREYDFEIHARTGEILEYDMEGKKSSASSSASGSISVEKAKELALQDAGVAAADAVFSKAKLDYDDGRQVYELKFKAGRYVYEYEIDAASGAILEADRD